ncbi:MAG: transposase [Nanoarchaeota archaeon]
MNSNIIDKWLKSFLKDIFCGVSANSPYKNNDFLHVLVDAAEHEDFTNNSAKRVGGPTGETVFSRLKDADFERIKNTFYAVMASAFPLVKRLLRNRKVALAFDITDEPYYGKVEGLWIHPQQPVRGSTGCFKYLTISAVDGENRLIFGSLPVRVGYDVVALVVELLSYSRQFVRTETLLFDRGFDNYRLIAALQEAGLHYQILWRKDKWTNKILKKMKRGQRHEVVALKGYKHNKSGYKIKVRFVFIKGYRRYNRGKSYNWIFATNIRRKWNHLYVDKYKMRWGIETIFRVLDRIGIKTTTKNEVIRYFLHLFCCLLYNLWKVARLFGCILSLKNFAAKLAKFLDILQLSLLDSS